MKKWSNIALLVGLGVVSCGEDGVVGGACRAGLTECRLECVDLQRDNANCGACGKVCSAEQVCQAGACIETSNNPVLPGEGGAAGVGGTPNVAGSAGSLVGGSAGDAGAAGNAGLGGNTGGFTGEGGTAGVGGASGSAGSAAHAGDNGAGSGGIAGNSGSAGTSGFAGTSGSAGASGSAGHAGFGGVSGSFGSGGDAGANSGGFAGVGGGNNLVCEEPLERCNAECVDMANDPKNCGKCGNACNSGICQGRVCVGRVPGHVLVIGMDYVNVPFSPPDRLLWNAVFGKDHKTRATRILSYVEHANVAAVTHVKSVVTTNPKPVWTDALDSETLLSELNVAKYDALVIFDQANAPASKLKTLGQTWQDALNSYVGAGGRAIILDGGTGTAEMKDLLSFSGLLAVASETKLGPVQLSLSAPTDELAAGLPNLFLAPTNTAAFDVNLLESSVNAFVIKAPSGAPVVLHLSR